MFEIKETGGTTGIGLSTAYKLLEHELKAVAIMGRNEENGKAAIDEINKKFGKNKAIFIHLSNYNRVKLLFHVFTSIMSILLLLML
ncbi:hypothetical protein FQA39_LY03943 [Lamprigera yunnana]|nr:hypothetical protein FQA39_LY03943 [Lamprigera yunnana]